MARTLCFHLDKHRDPAIAAGLRLHRVDVTTTPDACLLSTEDEEHIIDALLARGELTETTRYLPSRHWSCHRTPWGVRAARRGRLLAPGGRECTIK